MKLALIALCLCVSAPVGAEVRMQSGNDSIVLKPMEKPAPAAMALPMAAPLTSPTLIPLSAISMTLPVAAASVNVSATRTVSNAVPMVTMAPPEDVNRVPLISVQMCSKALEVTTKLAMLSYDQTPTTSLLDLGMAATSAQVALSRNKWPNLGAFNTAREKMPVNVAQRTELWQMTKAVQELCRPATHQKVVKGSALPVARPN
jgi:hypothetical protein